MGEGGSNKGGRSHPTSGKKNEVQNRSEVKRIYGGKICFVGKINFWGNLLAKVSKKYGS